MNTQSKISIKITSTPRIHCAPHGGFIRFGNSPVGIWGECMRAYGIDVETKKRCTLYWYKSDPAVIQKEAEPGFLFFELSPETIGNPTIVFNDGTVLDADDVSIIRKQFSDLESENNE